MRLLLVEDDPRLAANLCKGLSQNQFSVDRAGSLEEARTYLAGTTYDAMLLDISLPDGCGLDLLCELRRGKSDLPVLALTARDSVEARVAGLDAGADDYLVKPFAMMELMARIRALLRRPGAVLGARLQSGNVSFDTRTRCVEIAGRHVVLSRRELALLEALMRRAGRVVGKEQLIDQMYDNLEDASGNAVTVHVHQLRRSLEDAGASATIVTLRGLGYLLTDDAGR